MPRYLKTPLSLLIPILVLALSACSSEQGSFAYDYAHPSVCPLDKTATVADLVQPQDWDWHPAACWDAWELGEVGVLIPAATLATLNTANAISLANRYNYPIPVLGRHPSTSEQLGLIVGLNVIGVGIAHAMPHPMRKAWLAGMDGSELFFGLHDWTGGTDPRLVKLAQRGAPDPPHRGVGFSIPLDSGW